MGGKAFIRSAARSRGGGSLTSGRPGSSGTTGRRRGEGDAVVVLVCSMSNPMTARAADRCRGVTCMGVFVGQGLIIQLSMDNTHSRTALLFWHHLGRGSCNRAIGRKGGTILNGSPALHYLDHPRRRLVAFLSGQDREGKPFRSPVPGFEVSWVWLTVSVVRYGSPQDAKRTHLVPWSLMSRLPPRRSTPA